MFEFIWKYFRSGLKQPKIIQIKTREELALEARGFFSADQAMINQLFRDNLFRYTSKEDNIVGVFSKKFKFDHSPQDDEYSGVVVAVIIKIPFQVEFMSYPVESRPCYSGEVIYKGAREPDHQPAYRGTLNESSLEQTIQALDNHASWEAWDLTRSYVHAKSSSKLEVKV